MRERRAAVVALAESLGGQLRFVNGGGTGSMATTRAESAVTEITVGSGFYSPALFDNYREFRFQPAAGFAIEIVRHPRAGHLHLPGRRLYRVGWRGHRSAASGLPASGRAARSAGGRGRGADADSLHGPERLALGDPIFLRHSQGGRTVRALHPSRCCVQNGAVVGEATTYRGDGQCFL